MSSNKSNVNGGTEPTLRLSGPQTLLQIPDMRSSEERTGKIQKETSKMVRLVTTSPYTAELIQLLDRLVIGQPEAKLAIVESLIF